jgi:hypothetical protein
MTRSLSQAFLVVLAAFAFIAAVLLVNGSIPRSDPGSDLARGAPEVDDGGKEEAEEQREATEERNEAFEAAKAAGTSGQRRPASAKAPAGWSGEIPVDTEFDDWEPAIAADPNAPYVYSLVTRYGAPKPCPGNCPIPLIVLEISADEGKTWSDGVPLCACKGEGQYDPIIEVVPNTGEVYAVFMIGFNVVFTKSADHGATWSAPVPTWGNVAWNDKPVMAMSDDGRDVYVSFNGPTGGDPWAAQSHDGGATWSQFKLSNTTKYWFAFDADVAHDGTVYLSESPLVYTNAGNNSQIIDTIEHHVFVSRDRGGTWEDHLVTTVLPGRPCTAIGCSPDFYTGHTALSVDDEGDVVLLYDGAKTTGGLQMTYARTSVDAGATWGPEVQLSKSGENSTAPAVESTGAGDVRAWYYETSGGGNDDAWNVWYRSSIDGGATWSRAVKISDVTGGAAYKTAAGFLEVYGDYGEIGITASGATIAIWGEGLSWTGPGGVWYSIQH